MSVSESHAEVPIVGSTIGNYRIVSTLGVGGMGTVYRAEHLLIGRAVAIKLLLPELTANREIVTRFFNEARATSAIKHPGIVEVFDFGYTERGHAYIVMELLEGETLGHRIKRLGRLPIGDAALLMRDVCSALAAAHDLHIVHRDLKPDNIFIVHDAEQGERTKILDFGIAKLTEVGLATGVTKTGAVMGTPTYMSPEQCRGTGHVDGRADLYSIGCILYELISGRPPFINLGAGELIGSHLFKTPEPLSQHAAVDGELDQLVMSLLEKEPEHRVQATRDLGEHLGMIAQLHGTHRPSMRNTTAPPSLPGHLTPAHYTPHRMPTPAHHTPHRMSVETISQQPTTLTGGASETAPAPAPGGSRRAGIVIGAALVTVALGVAAFVVLDGGGSSTTRASAPPAAVPVRSVTPDAAMPTPDAGPAEPAEPPEPPDAATASAPDAQPTIEKPKPKPKPKPDPKKPRKPDDLLETDL